MSRTAGALGRRIAFTWAAAALAWMVAMGSVARADSRTDFLVGRLKADDFRVRTNAALALGQSGDDSAVPALCGAIGDSSVVVRQAVVAALEKLAKPAAVGCLQGAGRGRIERRGEARDRPRAGQDRRQRRWRRWWWERAVGGPPPTVAGAKYYVSISPVANQTGRPDADITRVVGGAVRSKLVELRGYQLAPDQESPEQARAAIGKRKLTGYYLSIRVERFDYSDGNLRVRVKVAVFSYPGKDLRGEVPAGPHPERREPGRHRGRGQPPANGRGTRRGAVHAEFPMIDVHNWSLVPGRAHHDCGSASCADTSTPEAVRVSA